VRLTLIGHATVLIELDGVRLLTDPLLRNRVTFLRAPRRKVDPSWSEGLDAVLLSHFHRDHYDPRSLKTVDPSTLVIGSPGTGARVGRHGFANVAELRPGESVTVGKVSVSATRAAHGRVPKPFRSSVALGFVVRGSASVYFAGDTDLFAEMEELAAEEVDVALLPIGGWGPRLGAGHLDPRRAAQSLRLIRPRIAVPMHWGHLRPLGLGRFSPRYLTAPGRIFARYAAELAPEVEVRVLNPGETLEVTPSPSAARLPLGEA
jgi:L-ascorbate metabolism protein UlaG (beta-lactamase superfamily)